MHMKRFLSGDEAFAEGVRLARPQVISAYPITPQTVVVERLSEMVEEGQLAAEYVHVESEHSALSCAIGASATGARTFTATSSQGLLYMAECLTYAAGGRFPIVMMNANRATALPWNIYGDQRDSLALLDHGWVQAYAQDNQEALDLALMAYAVAEDPRGSHAVHGELGRFRAHAHLRERWTCPAQEQADAFLPPYDGAGNRFDFEHPVNIGFSAGPEYNRYFKHSEHRGHAGAPAGVVERAEAALRRDVRAAATRAWWRLCGCEDADYVLVTLGSAAGLVRDRGGRPARTGRARGPGAHPLPAARCPTRQIVEALARRCQGGGRAGKGRQSFGAEGTVFTNVNSALQQAGMRRAHVVNFIGGLGGDDITPAQVEAIVRALVPRSLRTLPKSRAWRSGAFRRATPRCDAASAASPADLAVGGLPQREGGELDMSLNAKTMADDEFFFGHKACAGCGASLAVRTCLKVLGPNAVCALPAGCMSAVGFNFPQLCFANNAMITPFAATASVLTGIEAGLRAQGKKPDDCTVVGFAGDGGTADIGLAGAVRRHRPQRRHALHLLRQRGVHEHGHPEELAHALRREDHHHAGRASNAHGCLTQKKNVFEIVAAHGIPYAATASSVGYLPDFMRKVERAARHPRHALHPRDRALPDRLGLRREADTVDVAQRHRGLRPVVPGRIRRTPAQRRAGRAVQAQQEPA